MKTQDQSQESPEERTKTRDPSPESPQERMKMRAQGRRARGVEEDTGPEKKAQNHPNETINRQKRNKTFEEQSRRNTFTGHCYE
ncbi:hypothetical protein NDU88_004247 [Pleurodeles waltl]|uniref:Uncharacterized protein n=1 Tax=Pleurodeles waltl TaxID=8319 RepID=A0AAV7RFK9_PLEWA|nr:hypothetical protein NDU88_004247 [Pleurodeles waltl]